MKSLIPWKEYNFMICHRIGFSPISTIGFGLTRVSSLNLEPKPPAKITTFMKRHSSFQLHPSCSFARSAHGEGSKLETNHCVSSCREAKVRNWWTYVMFFI